MNIQALTPEDFLRVLLKRKWWIFASIVVCLVLGYLGWRYSPKTFKSTVIMTIDSPRIAKEYVKGLAQEGRYNDDPTVIILQQVTLALTNKSILMPILDTLKPDADAELVSSDILMKRLRKSVVLGRPKEGIGISISYTHSEPHMAQAVTALLARNLQEDHMKRREGIVETTTEFLSVELERVKGDLEVKEHAISDFKRAHMGELPEQMEANLRTLDRLQTDLTNSSEALNKLGERLTALERTIKDFPDQGSTGFVLLDREREQRVGNTRLINPRVARLQELKQHLSELLATYKENYPDIVHVKEEIRRLELVQQGDVSQSSGNESEVGKADDSGGVGHKPIDPYLRELMKERSEAKSEIAFLKEKQTSAIRQIKELEARVEHTPMREQSLAVLLRDHDNLQKSYQALLDKRTNARLMENYENRQFGEQYRIIEPASLPDVQEPPTLIHFLLGSIMLGCLIGYGSAVGVEIMKTGFRRPEDVEIYLGLPVLASIPTFASPMMGHDSVQAQALLTGPGASAGKTGDTLLSLGSRGKGVSIKSDKGGRRHFIQDLQPKFHLIAKWLPASFLAEQYRVAATRLILMATGQENVVMLVTSSVMGEGKTTTAVNLAHILAHDLNKSTLLIDCDFKRPMVHEYMGVPTTPGLGEVLQEGEILENCIHQCDGESLWVLPSGSPKFRPAGLSGIQYIKKVLPELRARYDYVILDGPPVMPLADVNILSGMADMTVFVVRASGTNRDIAKKALRVLGVNSDVTGIIFTQVETEYAPNLMYAEAYTNENIGSR